MKKKLLSLLLALAMICSLAVPAAAAQPANDRLAAVTARVKETLDLDTGPYTDFYGDLMEDLLAPSWELSWSGDGGSLYISATEEGKILSYRRYEERGTQSSGGYAPSFPAGDQDAAKAAAQSFLEKVLSTGETSTMEASTVRLNATAYRFSGEILLNGLSAGLSYSISVRCEDNAVMSFSRDDLNGIVMGGIPSASANVSAEQARAALRSTLALRLEYVLPQDGGKQAVLRYLPESGDEYYLDAASGALVNLTELAQKLGEDGLRNAGSGASTAAADANEAAALSEALTQAEQQGVERLKDVLSRETLDAKVRTISALGLDAYTLSGVDYTVSKESGGSADGVTAALRYGRQVNGASWRRTITVDAETGALIRVSSSAWMPSEPVARTVFAENARAAAEAFLRQQCGAQFAQTELYNSADAMENEGRVSHSFTFAQKVNGYFCPANSITVGVDATDGSISAYQNQFDDAVLFDSTDGILTMDQALDAWLDTYTVELAYVMVPAAIDYSDPEYRPLADSGISYLYQLVLGYTLEREDYLLGIDAKTGAAVRPPWITRDNELTYSDLSAHWAKGKIETLARYGVGYVGGVFRPDSALTQLDLVALLASTEGYLYDGGQEGAADALYEYAYSLGILKRADRDDSRILTRVETVRYILDAVGCGPIAQLEGIFRTGFADDGSIPGADYGYAALAQGLGMVAGDEANRFLPNAAATRAQAAVMLYNLMAR